MKIKKLIPIKRLKKAIKEKGYILFNNESKEELIEIYKDSITF